MDHTASLDALVQSTLSTALVPRVPRAWHHAEDEQTPHSTPGTAVPASPHGTDEAPTPSPSRASSSHSGETCATERVLTLSSASRAQFNSRHNSKDFPECSSSRRAPPSELPFQESHFLFSNVYIRQGAVICGLERHRFYEVKLTPPGGSGHNSDRPSAASSLQEGHPS